MIREPIKPRPPYKTQYGIPPESVTKRASELRGIASVWLRDLFPDTPAPIYPNKKGVAVFREETEKLLEKIDTSEIKPTDTIDILASHHGFVLMGGEPYAEMIRTIKDVMERRTGAKVRLKIGSGARFREPDEYIKMFRLDEYFDKEAYSVSGIDEGIIIETEFGSLPILKKMYTADWFIHVMHNDIRELHFHRQIDRAFKPFAMSYARVETRSAYHQSLGPRACNFIPRAIFESRYVQEKYFFTCTLVVLPSGIIGVDADSNLHRLNDRLDRLTLRHYSKIIRLFGMIDECIAILDAPCPIAYGTAAGSIFANLLGAHVDLFDLSVPLPPYSLYAEPYYDEHGNTFNDMIPAINPALKMVVNNYSLGGIPGEFFSKTVPTIVVGKEQAELFRRDPSMQAYMNKALLADNLDAAMDFAYKATGTDKVIIFDNAEGGINLSKSLAKLFIDKASIIDRIVDEELYPKWLKQRGIGEARE